MANVPIPTKNKKTFDLSFPHITTQRFYEPNVAMIIEAVAGSKFTIKQSTFRRLDPMPLPPLSQVRCSTKYYFVPMLTIFPAWQEFKTLTATESGKTLVKNTKVHVLQNTTILNLLKTSNYSEAHLIGWDGKYDFMTTNGKYVLKTRGRILVKLLNQLGYDFTAHSYASEIEFSAMPLLAFAKVIFDHYINPQFINDTTRYSAIRTLFTQQESKIMTQEELDLICDFMIFTCYMHDYFVDAFVNESGPTYNESTEIGSMNDELGGTIDSRTNNVVQYAPYNGKLTKKGIDILKSMSNFMMRNNIAGGRFVDRLLVQFGYKPNNIIAKRSSFIEENHQNVSIEPVLNTTDEQLGQFAGFGQNNDEADENQIINIDTNDLDGYIIAIDTITPELYYINGVRRHVLHKKVFDFYTPQYDCLGTDAVSQAEIAMSKRYDRYCTNRPDLAVFGYKPRYSEYKENYGIVTGDFRIPSVNTDLDGYQTARKINPDDWLVSGSSNEYSVTQSKEFAFAYDREQYNRLFYVESETTDYMKSVFRFDIELDAPFKGIDDFYQFEHDENSVDIPTGGEFKN